MIFKVKVINYDKFLISDVKIENISKIIFLLGLKVLKDYEKIKKVIEYFKGEIFILGVCLGY